MKSDTLINTWFNPTKMELKEIKASMIAFDFDSTINEMGEPMGDWIAEFLGVDEVRGRNADGTRSFHFESPGITNDEMAYLVHKYVCEQTHNLDPTPYAVEVLHYIHTRTIEPITVITYRPADSAEITHKWLVDHLTVPFNLIMLDGMQKNVVLGRLGTEVYIDDRYKTVEILEKVVNLSVMYARPWNQGRSVEAGDMTVEDLRGLIPIINLMTRTPILTWPSYIPRG